MTYITKFSNVQITGSLNGNGNIDIAGNIAANNEALSSNAVIGNLSITTDPSSNITTIAKTDNNNLVISGTTVNLESATLNLGNTDTGNVQLFGGAVSQYLTTDGAGNLIWGTPQGQGNGVVGGTPGAIEINNGYGFGGDLANLSVTYTTANVGNSNVIATTVTAVNANVPLTLGNSGTASGLIANTVDVVTAASNLYIQGGANGQILFSTGPNTAVVWQNFPLTPPQGPNGALQYNANGQLDGSANLVLTDDLTHTVVSLRSDALTLDAHDVDATISSTTGNITVATPSGNLILPTVANINIPGGSNNFVLTSIDANGNLEWTPRTIFLVNDVANAGPVTPNPETQDIITISYAGNVSVILPTPTANTIGSFFHIKDIWGGNRAANPVTITALGGSTIDGQINVQITGAFNSIQIAQVSDTNWGVL
jgi:hypothetical protein